MILPMDQIYIKKTILNSPTRPLQCLSFIDSILGFAVPVFFSFDLNPFMPSGFFYLSLWTGSFLIQRASVLFYFIFYFILLFFLYCHLLRNSYA